MPKSLLIQENTEDFIETSLEARDIKIKVTDIDIPVSFSTAFEGEIIRRGNMRLEVDGSRKDCFELSRMRDAADVEDHKIELIGKDFGRI